MSDSLQDRASKVFPSGCLTYSKSPRYYVSAIPTHVLCGDGKHLIPAEKNAKPIFDTVSGLGSNLVSCKNNFSLPTDHEVLFAEALLHRLPPYNRVKFVKTGSEACQTAVRYARAFPNYGGIMNGIGLGYHGFHNCFISAEYPGVGTVNELYSKRNSIEEVTRDVACGSYAYAIVEPVMLDADVKGKLVALRRACTETKTILIFDEVITGWRWPKYTVAHTYDVFPDLLVLGKAIGGGFSVGAVVGYGAIMDIPGVFISTTFAGEECAMKSGYDLVSSITQADMKFFWDASNAFMERIRYSLSPKITINGYGTRIVLGDNNGGLDVAKYMQEMYLRHRILIGPVMFPKISWTAEDYTAIIEASKEIIPDIDKVELIGEIPSPVFKRN